MLEQKRFQEILKSFEKINPILVTGDIGVDKYTKGRVSRISPEAPVPVIEVFEEWNKLGLATNVSDNLQSLLVKSTVCGVVGDDANGSNLENLLEEKSMSTWGIVRCSERMTTFKERVVTDTQQVCRVDYETKSYLNSSTEKRVLDRMKEMIEGHSAIIVEDYGKGFFTQNLTSKLIAMAKDHKIFIAVDPSRTTPPSWYKGVDLLKPNQLESELMVKLLGYQETDTQKISEILIDKLDLNKLIITLGAEGMAITDRSDGGKMKMIPTVAREVYDVSGAGDTAISTIVAAISAGATLEEAAWLGNCASGVVVGKKGTALVTPSELTDFYSELQSL